MAIINVLHNKKAGWANEKIGLSKYHTSYYQYIDGFQVKPDCFLAYVFMSFSCSCVGVYYLIFNCISVTISNEHRCTDTMSCVQP